MNKIKLDDLKAEISNLKRNIELLRNKKSELNELIYKPSTFESDERIYRIRENEVLSEIKLLSEHLVPLQREAKDLEFALAAESKANREKEWLAMTPENLNDSINTVIDDINVLSEKRSSLKYQINFLVVKRNKVVTIINSVAVLQDEIKIMRKQIAVLKVDQTTGKEVNDINKVYEQKRKELNLVKDEVEHATEELTELTTRIDALRLRLSHIEQNRKDLETTYYLHVHRKAEIHYMDQAANLMVSLRHMRAIETLIPQYRQPSVSIRLLSRLNSHGLEIPTYEGVTEKPKGLQDLFKDLDNEINELKGEMIAKVDSEL